MSRLSGKVSRSLRSRAGAVVVVLAGLASVVCYAAVSVTVNGQPSTAPFRGFVTLLQPAAVAFSQDQVKLVASPLAPGGPGQHPGLSYAVAVCGNQPFQGVLLIGGDARLSHVRGIPALGLSNANGDSSNENLPDLTLLDEGTGTGLDLGPVQAIHLTMSDPGRCASNYSAEQTPPPPFLGQSQVIAGQADAPVQRQWRLGWWSGPRSGQELATGRSIPGVNFNDLGEFQALSGLSGAWGIRPGRQYVAVSAGGLQPRAQVDYARPPAQHCHRSGLGQRRTRAAHRRRHQHHRDEHLAELARGRPESSSASAVLCWPASCLNGHDPAINKAPPQEPAPQPPIRPFPSQPTSHRLTTSAVGLLLAWIVISRRRRSSWLL